MVMGPQEVWAVTPATPSVTTLSSPISSEMGKAKSPVKMGAKMLLSPISHFQRPGMRSVSPARSPSAVTSTTRAILLSVGSPSSRQVTPMK